MEQNKNKQTYLTAIYQNTMTGIQSIRDIESKVKDNGLKDELTREVEKFNEIRVQLEQYAEKNNLKLSENNIFEKVRLWASINMATLSDNSTRHIAEMMLLGTVMGLTTCYKDKFDHKKTDKNLDDILESLESIEEENYKILKQFLILSLIEDNTCYHH